MQHKVTVVGAGNVGAMVAQIASASTQQATASAEVTTSMAEISELAADAANGSQLSARACGQLFDMALTLRNMVDRFDVGQRAGAAKPAAAVGQHWPAEKLDRGLSGSPA